MSEACMDTLKQCLEVNPKKRPTMEEIADHPWLKKISTSFHKRRVKL